MTAPLDDITVIEIDNWMAAPSAGAIMADMGARVIKIEPLRGDPMRNMSRPPKVEDDAVKAYDFQFDVDNRGKESICVDLTTDEGIALVHKLCENANIFLCNLLKPRQEKYNLDPESLFKINPRLVHATLTGYGTTGPEAWRPGYDVTAFFGRSGLYDAMREGAEGLVPMARPAQGDHTAGLALLGGILASLRMVDKTGEGQVIETSLYETAVWTQAADFAVTVIDNAPVRKRARDELLSPTANRYPCGDGNWIVFNMPEPRHWPKFCDAINRREWLDDERLQDPRGRFRHMHELVPEIDKALAEKSRDEWGVIFDREGLIWGPVLGLHEVSTDPQAEAINLFPKLQHETLGEYRTVNIPMRFKNADVKPRSRAPLPGEHTDRVLSEAGLSSEELTSLKEGKVISQL